MYKRLQAMVRNTSGDTPAELPPDWDEEKNIYIQYKQLRRIDHLLKPKWADFQEYCENIPSTDLQAKLDAVAVNLNAYNLEHIGITELSFSPFADEINPATWAYNSDYNNSNSRWTDGNTFKVYHFYYITRRDADTPYADQNAPDLLRLYQLRQVIEGADLYSYGEKTQNVCNRNLLTYYGTKKKGSGGSMLELFKIGDTETLNSVQYAANFAGGRYLTYDYTSRMNSGASQPFSNGRQLTDQAYIYSEPGITLALNNQKPAAAVLGYFNNRTITTIGSYTYRFSGIYVATTKTITERNILQ